MLKVDGILSILCGSKQKGECKRLVSTSYLLNKKDSALFVYYPTVQAVCVCLRTQERNSIFRNKATNEMQILSEN